MDATSSAPRAARALPRFAATLSLLAVLTGSAAGPAAAATTDRLAEARALLDGEDAAAALKLLDGAVKQTPNDATTLLLRSTALLMLGDLERGRRDLDRALEIDPDLRQGWLNRAALDLSEGRLDAALDGFSRARDLDPTAPDGHLNVGAVELMRGELPGATASFGAYLEAEPNSTVAFYLVASNYAMAGYAGLAIEHLHRAIQLDEKARLRARTDPNFGDLTANPRMQQLLSTDDYRLPMGSYRAAREFELPYEGAASGLLPVVVDAVQIAGRAFDRRIEVTASWALLWTDLRIKVSAAPGDRGRIEISAPGERFSTAAWEDRSAAFFRAVAVQLAARQPQATRPPAR